MKSKKLETATCPECGYKESYEPDEFGLTYFQAIGSCPNCGAELQKTDGTPTAEIIKIEITSNPSIH